MKPLEVLEKLANKEYISKEQIAKELGISRGEAELAFQILEDLGYIRRISFSCNTKYCSSCPFRNICNTKVEIYEIRKDRK
ncbi:MAG: DNA-binding protein [Thermoproteota archaeon]|jgi:DNA-binding Lrp family transcriptional regulator